MNERSSSRHVTAPRPNPASRWRCGFESMGMACEAGPTEAGQCCQTAARRACSSDAPKPCQEVCAGAANCEIAKLRPDSLRLTNDDLGPCIPVRTAWFSRQTLALNAAILAGGLLLCCMALPSREAVFVPGGLSTKHSQILGNRLVSQRCSLCHPNSHSAGSDTIAQDDLCMNCHQAHMPQASLRSPHDLTQSQLESLLASGTRSELPPEQAAARAAHFASEPTHCASCHSEHHGPGHAITAMSDARCQACHQQRFASFDAGHPEFDGYPYRQQRRLAFDHATHADKYYSQKNQSFECAGCHLEQPTGGRVNSVMRSVGFEQACGACHREPIRAGMSDGWVLLQVPSLDADDVRDASQGLRAWPANAQFGYDGQLTLPMQLLLAADPALETALDVLPKSGKLSDVELHRPEQLEAVRTLARGMQRLIAEVAAEGQTAWQRRLEQVGRRRLQRELQTHERDLIALMVSGLPPDLFRQMERLWFQSDATLAVETSESVAGGRFVSETIPTTGASAAAADKGAATGEPTKSATADELLESTDADLLLDTPTSELLLEDDADLLLAPPDAGADLHTLQPLGLEDSARVAPPAKPALPKVRGATHVTQGGWYLDGELLTVCYMPQGHADPLLAAWTEFATLIAAARTPQTPARALDHGRLPTGTVPGDCTECHLLPHQSAEAGVAMENWRSVQHQTGQRLFTKFAHAPHLTLPMVRDCQFCHELDRRPKPTLADIRSSAEYGRLEWPVDSTNADRQVQQYLQTEFRDMQQQQCNACHRQGGANHACTQCHHYHINSAF